MSEKKGSLADPQVVSETIDLVRRSLEIQRSETERIYVRTESLSRLLVATLAGMIAIIGLVANSGVSIAGGTFAVLILGTTGLITSLVVFISLLTGFPRPTTQWAGARPRVMLERISDPEWTVHRLRGSTARELVEASEHQEDLQERILRKLGTGIALFLLSGLLLLVTLFFILGGHILA